MITENFLELIDIDEIKNLNKYINMIDLDIKDDHSFLMSNGLISHNSASGALKQARNAEIDGVYALRGKIKNAKRLSDLSNNIELLELMSILGLDPSKRNRPVYESIIIATDSDFDGSHIAALLINLFYKWFPNIIEDGHLKKIITPLVVGDFKNKRKYFYSLEEFNNFTNEHKNEKVSNVNYLKGLGSLSIEDWNYVMNNKTMFQIINDRSSKKYLDIAFGDDSLKKKKWLTE